MKVLKVFSGVVLLVVVVLAIVVAVVANNLNGIVKTVVEEVGSETLGTTVSLGKADISLVQSRVVLSGLKIGNPSGFTTPNVFSMDNVVVDLDPSTLWDKTISVEEITIDGAVVVAEQKGQTTNVQALLKNIDTGGSDAEAGESTPEEGSASDIDILIKVASFQFINSEATLVTEQWGDADLDLTEIRLKDIGGSQGVPPEGLAEEIVTPIVQQIKSALEDQLKDLAEEKVKEKLKEKEDEAKAKLTEKLDEKLGEGGAESLKSLFK